MLSGGQAAVLTAKELREQGFEVTVTDPDGMAVDETEAE
jgi:Trk K+ transport system NAD-binding subunit